MAGVQRRTLLGMGTAAFATCLLPQGAWAEDAARLVLSWLSVHRRNAGLPELAPHPALVEMAQRQAFHMQRIGEVSHTSPDGLAPPGRALQTGYEGRVLGEALAESRTGPVETVDYWLAEKATRAVLLDPEARNIGVFGLFTSRKSAFWDLVVGAG